MIVSNKCASARLPLLSIELIRMSMFQSFDNANYFLPSITHWCHGGGFSHEIDDFKRSQKSLDVADSPICNS